MTIWNGRNKPTSQWESRVGVSTSWGARNRPNTSWGDRNEVDTDWDGRRRPITYMTPLEDAYTKVADEDNEIIYILANSGKLIPATFWNARPQVI